MHNSQVFRNVKSWKRSVHAAVAVLAKFYLKLLPNVQVIAITGSVGKTLTQNAIYSVLSQKYKTVVGSEDLDPTFRIPQTILRTRPWDKYLVLEYGVEHPGDMDYYLDLVKPQIGIITTIASTHTKYFGSEKGVFEEKSKLIKALGSQDTAILNSEDKYSFNLKKQTKAKIIWFGTNSKNGVKIYHFRQDLKEAKFSLHYHSQKDVVSWKIIGQHHLLSAYIACAVGIACGLTLKQIAKGLSQVKPPAHRLNIHIGKKFSVIADTYNSSPKAALEAINTLLELGKRRKKIVILGEMKDLGKLSSSSHQDLGKKIAKNQINYLVTVGKVASSIAAAAKSNSFKGGIIEAENTNQAAKAAKKLIDRNSLILVKGSRHSHLERIVYALLGKSTQIKCYHCGSLS